MIVLAVGALIVVLLGLVVALGPPSGAIVAIDAPGSTPFRWS
jgi:hypothetical protein